MMYTYTTPSGVIDGLFDHMLKQTHLLIAGASGAGKSVLVNGLLVSALYELPFDCAGGVQFILIDPKRVELSPYQNLPHCICYASEPAHMIAALHYAVSITETRYSDMANRGLRKYDGGSIYVVIEELADLMLTNRQEVQPLIQRLSQIGRAANVHIIAVTQCPLVTVIPTPIKVSFDGIVALRTRSAQDSRNIIGVTGAELLPRYGECLYYSPDLMEVKRFSIPNTTDAARDAMIAFWLRQRYEQSKPKKRGILRRLFGRA